jgi:hypothetical protein
VQLLRELEGRLVVDATTMHDRPDFPHRRLYIESEWGPDLMDLDDWRDLIDYMAILS